MAPTMDAPPVQYVPTGDGYKIAYSVTGEGQPLVLMPAFPFNHIQLYWTEETWYQAWLRGLASRFRLVQYDSRGQGMSTRGIPKDLSFRDLERDLEAVVGRLQLDGFVLMTRGASGHVAVHYSIKHSERVRALVWNAASLDAADVPALYLTLAEQNWDVFLKTVAGVSQADELDAPVRRLQQTSTQADWLALVRAAKQSTVAAELPLLKTPTLLLHPRDFMLSLEASSEVTAAIPDARMVALDGPNFGDVEQGLMAIDEFLAGLPPGVGQPAASRGSLRQMLSPREVDVLRLLAAGKGNQQIADELVISLNTVLRHVSNIFAKTGAANRTEAAIYARDKGII
jgi:DNA-binding CsgD family transcriptional regulator/pimeloyl-ACP methyl ester carboxylesterase